MERKSRKNAGYKATSPTINSEEAHHQAHYPTLNRREFMSGVVGRVTGVTLTTGVVGSSTIITSHSNATGTSPELAQPVKNGKGFVDGEKRRKVSFKIRKSAARDEKNHGVIDHETNGDKDEYPNRIGNFSKTLPHDSVTGEVDPDAYNALLHALNSAKFDEFENIPTGGQDSLVNPMGGFACNIEGPDNAAIKINPPPAYFRAMQIFRTNRCSQSLQKRGSSNFICDLWFTAPGGTYWQSLQWRASRLMAEMECSSLPATGGSGWTSTQD